MSAVNRGLADARRWTERGTALFLDTLDRVPDAGLAAASALPGWTRAHVVAHVAANAEALGNLVHWARTGEPTPMYSSPEQRAADIENGARRPAAELRAWVRRASAALADGMATLTDDQWRRQVRTAQGRTVPATEVPWLRSREVLIHAVDLRAGVAFADLPEDFLAALLDDIAARRSATPGPALRPTAPDGRAWTITGDGDPVTVRGPLAELAAYLAGRAYRDLTVAGGGPIPDLPAWL